MTPGKPAKVVMLLQDLYFGGTQRQTLELAKRMDRERFNVEFWMLCAGTDFAAEAEKHGIKLSWLSNSPQVQPQVLPRLWRKLKAERPDVLLLLTAVPNIWGRIFGRLQKLPAIIATCRGGGAPKRQHEKYLWRLAHHHICNTEALRRNFLDNLKVPAEMVTTILNGVDSDYFAPPAEEFRPVRQVILCLARLAEDKDHETLLQAFAILAPKFPLAELWLVGDGPLKSSVHKMVMRHKVSNRIRMFPAASDPRPFLQQARIAVLSSVREGLPNVILEAMSSGLPVVATNVGGLPEVVSPGETGLLSPARDPEALAAALGELLADDEMSARLGRAGREKVLSNYSMREMVARHEAVFEQVLAQAGR